MKPKSFARQYMEAIRRGLKEVTKDWSRIECEAVGLIPITTISEHPVGARMAAHRRRLEEKMEPFVPEVKYDFYISGPITSCGVLEANLARFEEAAAVLRGRGYRVFSPPEDEPPGLQWEEYLRRDIKELMHSRFMVVLPGWDLSDGASLEVTIAKVLGMLVFTLSDVLAIEDASIDALEQTEPGFIPPIDPEGDPDDIIEFEDDGPPAMTAREFLASPAGKQCHETVKQLFTPEGRTFSTGSVRDTIAGKGRFDLLPPRALREVAKHFQRGAEKYGERNWEKGQPIRSSFLDSGFRHLMSVLAGEKNEDHLVACAWNILCALETRERIAEGILPAELNDLP